MRVGDRLQTLRALSGGQWNCIRSAAVETVYVIIELLQPLIAERL
jgi:hypothetical protein